jgi:hypothetical protein
MVAVRVDQNNSTYLEVENATAGNASYAYLSVKSSAVTGVLQVSSGSTAPAGLLIVPNQVTVANDTPGTGGVLIMSSAPAAGDVVIAAGGAALTNERFRCSWAGGCNAFTTLTVGTTLTAQGDVISGASAAGRTGRLTSLSGTESGLWLGGNAGAATAANASLLFDSVDLTVGAPTGGAIRLAINGVLAASVEANGGFRLVPQTTWAATDCNAVGELGRQIMFDDGAGTVSHCVCSSVATVISFLPTTAGGVCP